MTLASISPLNLPRVTPSRSVHARHAQIHRPIAQPDPLLARARPMRAPLFIHFFEMVKENGD